MQALTTPAILTGASTRLDGSLGLRFSTPELTSQEKVAILDLQGKALKILIQPDDETTAGMKEVKGELSNKTPSQRLRSVLFVFWKQTDDLPPFDVFYGQWMDATIDKIKLKLKSE